MKKWSKFLLLTISIFSLMLLTGCDKWNVMQGPDKKQIAAEEEAAAKKKEKEKKELEKIKVNPKKLGSRDESIVKEETEDNKHKNIGDEVEDSMLEEIKQSFKDHNMDIDKDFISIQDDGNNIYKVEVKNANVEASSNVGLYKYNKLTKELFKQDIFSGGEYILVE